MINNLPTMQETRVQSLGGKDPLEKEMATHFSILAWRIPWTEEPGMLVHEVAISVGHLKIHGMAYIQKNITVIKTVTLESFYLFLECCHCTISFGILLLELL